MRILAGTRGPWKKLVLTSALFAFFALPSGGFADGTHTLGIPSIGIQSGTGIIAAGTGLSLQPGFIEVTVPAGATVEQVLLYWEGHHREGGGPDDTIVVDGIEVLGESIGGPVFWLNGDISTTFRADITALGLINPGFNALSVEGLSFNTNNGAGVLVIIDDGSGPSTLTIRDGNDTAFFNWPEPLQTTAVQTFTFAPTGTQRIATLSMFFSSVRGEETRASAIDVTVNGVTETHNNLLDSTDGEEWDTVVLNVVIPADVTTLTAQAFSEDRLNTGNVPASFAWNAAALSVPVTPSLEHFLCYELEGARACDGGVDFLVLQYNGTAIADIEVNPKGKGLPNYFYQDVAPGDPITIPSPPDSPTKLGTEIDILVTPKYGAPLAPVLYAESHVGPDGPSVLYELDPATGAATVIGPIGFERCSGMDFSPTGTLYATCERSDGSNEWVLVTIDTITGAGTEIGPTAPVPAKALTDISFCGATLYGYDGAHDKQSLNLIDANSGAGMFVGFSGSAGGGNGLACSPTNTIFHATSNSGRHLNTLDPGTGLATLHTALSFPGFPPSFLYRVNGLDFKPSSASDADAGVLFASLNDGLGGSGANFLVTIDTTTGVVSLRGQSVSGLDSIAWSNGAVSTTVGAPTTTAIHTSCSKPIFVGLEVGDFTVLDGSSVKGGPFPETAVEGTRLTLEDQFGTGLFGIDKVDRLCNPADKNDEGISDPNTHFVGYKIKPPKACDGGVDQLTLRYVGEFPVNITVAGKTAGPVFGPQVVAPLEEFTFPEPPQKLGTETTITFVDDGTTLKFHTSCSKPIGVGSRFGDFLVVAGSSVKGGALMEAPTQSPTDCECRGGVDTLSLQYNGTEIVSGTVEPKGKGAADVNFTLSPGETLTIGTMDQKLGSEIKIHINGDVFKVHTSCSQPIGPGTPVAGGLFTVVEAGSVKSDAPVCEIVKVTNQFGEQFVDVQATERLLVPSHKEIGGPPGGQTDFFPIDHFECHKVKGFKDAMAGVGLVSVVDQFQQAKLYEIVKPKSLCAPVLMKDVHADGAPEITAALDAVSHLMCFQVKVPKGEARHDKVFEIFTNNQLGPLGAFNTKKEKELCVPSTKSFPADNLSSMLGLNPTVQMADLGNDEQPGYLAAAAQFSAGVFARLRDAYQELASYLVPTAYATEPVALITYFEELEALKDATLLKNDINTNAGGSAALSVGQVERAVVGFDLGALPDYEYASEIIEAKLILTTVETNPPTGWGARVPDVAAYLLAESFSEGDGDENGFGSGEGVTYACATDTDIANPSTDCESTPWDGGSVITAGQTALDKEFRYEDGASVVEWDVTSDVQSALAGGVTEIGWLLKKKAEDQVGQVVYYSKDLSPCVGYSPRLVVLYGRAPDGAEVGVSSPSDPAPDPVPPVPPLPPLPPVPPEVAAPADLSVAALDPSGTPASDPEIAAWLASATAMDDIDLVPAPSHDAPAVFPLGATLVTFSSTDNDGNIGTAAATVTVLIGGTRVTDGQLALYTFEEGAGDTVSDVSGMGTPLDLTVLDPAAVSWLPGGGLSINTPTTISSAGPATKVRTAMQASQALTIEAWVVPDNNTQFGPARIAALGLSGSGGGDFVMGQDRTQYETRLRTSATNKYGTPSLASGSGVTLHLTHVVYTRDASGTRRFYVNDVEVASGTVAGDFSNWGDFALALGNEPSGDRPWLGELHLVALYDRALDAADVSVNYRAGVGSRVTDGRLALYTFEEGSGDTVNDVSGVGAPLDLTVLDASAVSWLPGGGLSIDAPTTISSLVPATKLLDGSKASQNLTIEAWVVPRNTTQFGPARIAALSLSGSGGGNFVMGQDRTRYDTRLRSSATNQWGASLKSPSETAPLQLTHLVFTRVSAGDTRLYINGVEVARGMVAGSFSNWGNYALALANEPSGDRPWLGELHMVAVYDRSLNAAEVSVNFAAGPTVTVP